MTAAQVNDGQSPVSEANLTFQHDPGVVGSTVNQTIAHGEQTPLFYIGV
jgi:hypothetical protein